MKKHTRKNNAEKQTIKTANKRDKILLPPDVT